MLDMTQINWSQDKRDVTTEHYLSTPDTTTNKLQFFLRGWHSEITSDAKPPPSITWKSLGACYGSAIGDAPIGVQVQIYVILLHQFLHSELCEDWSAGDRETALGQFVDVNCDVMRRAPA